MIMGPGERAPILFLGGLSGAGKTTFASRCLAGEHNWLWMEIDLPLGLGRDGIDCNGLRSPWDTFLAVDTYRYPAPNAVPLYEELSRRKGSHHGVVLTFSSMQVFQESHLAAGEGYFSFAYLSGPETLCRKACVEREVRLAQPGTPQYVFMRHWDTHNQAMLAELRKPYTARLRMGAFNENGTRRQPSELYGDVLSLIRRPKPLVDT